MMQPVDDDEVFHSLSSSNEQQQQQESKQTLILANEPLKPAEIISAHETALRERIVLMKQRMDNLLTRDYLTELVTRSRERGHQKFMLRLCDYDEKTNAPLFSSQINYEFVFRETVKEFVQRHLDPSEFRVWGAYDGDGSGPQAYWIHVQWREPNNTILYRFLCFPLGC